MCGRYLCYKYLFPSELNCSLANIQKNPKYHRGVEGDINLQRTLSRVILNLHLPLNTHQVPLLIPTHSRTE